MGPASYAIHYKGSAAKALRKLDRTLQKRIIYAIEELATNPFPPGAKKIQGGKGEYRVRVGDFRVIYDVDSGKLIILVLKVGHRREIYRKP